MRFVVSIQFAIGILSVTKAAVNAAGHDGWMSILAAGIIVGVAMLTSIVLCNRFKDKSILDIDREIFGRYAGFCINIVLVIYLVIATAINLRYFVITVSMWLLSSTPMWIITLLVLAPSVYIVFKGLKNICRFSVIIFPIMFMAILLLIYGVMKIRVTLLLPLGSGGFAAVIKGVPSMAFSYMGFETLLFIFPYIKDRHNAGKSAVIAVLAITAFYVATSVVIIGIFGENYVKHLVYPLTSLARLVRFPIFERIDLYFYALWIPGMVLCINSYLFCTFDSIKKIFRIKSSLPLLAVLVLVMLILGGFINDINKSIEYSNYIGIATYGVGILLPVLWLIIALISGKGKGKGGKREKAG